MVFVGGWMGRPTPRLFHFFQIFPYPFSASYPPNFQAIHKIFYIQTIQIIVNIHNSTQQGMVFRQFRLF